jgi:hypothetical protein
MKAATIFHRIRGLIVISFLVFCLALPLQLAQAEDSDDSETSGTFSREQLAQMLAPIALYPDTLLSQVLMASTYPIEVVEAERWVSKNPGLKGEALDAALLDMDWDPSVKAMCHFPSILSLMSERIGETTDIGNAFLAQEADVMGMVQELRARAHAQNHLVSDSRQKVIVQNETIVIEPTDPKVIYVSYYDPAYIYGPWWYPGYPPYYWGPPGVSLGVGVSYWPGIYFGLAFGGWSYFDWHNHYIYVDSHKRPRFVRNDRWRENPGRWIHAPDHRRGVVYRDASTARRFSPYPHRSREFDRDTHRVPDHRDQGGDRRFDDRDRMDPNHRWEDRRTIDRERIDRDRQNRERSDRDQQERERIDRDRQNRERTDRGQQERERIDRDRQSRERADHDQQERERIDRDRQHRERIDVEKRRAQQIDSGKQERDRLDRDRRVPEQTETNRQGRDRVETERKVRDRVDGDPQRLQQLDREKKARDRMESEQQQKSRDNVVTPQDDGRPERQSNDRGWDNRRGGGDDTRDRGRSDDGGRGGHNRR